MSDAELVSRSVELAARMDAAEALLLALPTSVIEPPYVELVIDEPALLDGIAGCGRVIAPRAVIAADLTLESARSRVWPGCTLQTRLVLQSAAHALQSAEGLEILLGAAAAGD